MLVWALVRLSNALLLSLLGITDSRPLLKLVPAAPKCWIDPMRSIAVGWLRLAIAVLPCAVSKTCHLYDRRCRSASAAEGSGTRRREEGPARLGMRSATLMDRWAVH